MQVERTEPKSR